MARHEHSVSNYPGGDVKLSSLEIGLHLFSPIYSTMMLIDRSEAFTASEADLSQTEGNVSILHLELDDFCICTLCTRSLLHEH